MGSNDILPEDVEITKKTPDLVIEKSRSKEEIYRFKKSISFIAQHYAGYNIDVLPLSKNDPEQTWKCTFDGERDEYLQEELKRFLHAKEIDSLDHIVDDYFKPQSIFYVEDDLESQDQDILLGLLDHESWHVVHDNYKYGFENMRQAMDEGYLPSSMGLIANGLADGRITYQGVRDSNIKRQRQLKLHKEYLDSVSDWPHASVTRQITLLIKLKMVQDFLGIIDENSFNKVKESLSPDVQQVFAKIEPSIVKYFAAKTAQEANQILTKEIWDEYKVLEKQAQNDKSIEELFDQAQNSGQSNDSIPFDQLSPDLQEKIREELDRQKNQSKSTEGVADISQSDNQSSDTESGSSDQQNEFSADADSSDDISQDIHEKIENTVGNTPIDLSQIPNDLRDKLKKAVEGMSNDDQDKLAQKARASLDEEQAEQLNKDLPTGLQMSKDQEGEYRPQLNTGLPQDAKQAKKEIEDFVEQEKKNKQQVDDLKRKISEAKRPDEIDDLLNHNEVPEQYQNEIDKKAQKKKEQLQKERKGKIQEMKKNDFMEQDETEPSREQELLFDAWQDFMKAIKPNVLKWQRFWENILPKKQTMEHGSHTRRSGKKLAPKALVRPNKRVTGKVMQARDTVESLEARTVIIFLLDISGSMSEKKKLEESIKALLTKIFSLEPYDVDVAFYCFDDEIEPILQLGEKFSQKPGIKYELMKLITNITGNKVEFSGRGGTDMGQAIQMANEDLNKFKKQFADYMSALFVYADGDTFGEMSGTKLTNFINGWEEYQGDGVRSKHLAQGFFLRGLKKDADSQETAQETPMEQYFGKRGAGTVVVDNYQSLSKEAFLMLRRAITTMTKKLHINVH